MSYQAYTVTKDGSAGPVLTVPFTKAFAKPPIVIVSPFWDGSSSGVGHVETVIAVSTTAVSITSYNSGSSYKLNILAVEPEAEHIEGMPISAGSVIKNSGNVTVQVAPPVPAINLLTAEWLAKDGVGNVDTVVSQVNSSGGGSMITINSGNQGSDYRVNYISAAPGGFGHVESGQVNKIGHGAQRIYFTTPFHQRPVVVISPRWDGSRAVSNIDTIINITTDYFDVTSNNFADSFSINWVAVPPHVGRRTRVAADRFDAAFAAMQTMMPQQAFQLSQYRTTLRAHLVDGQSPAPSVFDIGYGLQVPPPRVIPRGPPSDCTEMVARCAFDALRLALSLAGLTISYTNKMAQAAIGIIADADKLSKFQTLITAYREAGNAWKKASALYAIVDEFYNSQGFAAILHALTDELTWWDWAVTGIIALAQLGAWIATDGVLFVSEVALKIMSFRSLPHSIELCYAACSLS